MAHASTSSIEVGQPPKTREVAESSQSRVIPENRAWGRSASRKDAFSFFVRVYVLVVQYPLFWLLRHRCAAAEPVGLLKVAARPQRSRL